MTHNMGRIDQFLRIVIGLAMFAYTVKDGAISVGWLALGVLGVILIITAFFSYCPLYCWECRRAASLIERPEAVGT